MNNFAGFVRRLVAYSIDKLLGVLILLTFVWNLVSQKDAASLLNSFLLLIIVLFAIYPLAFVLITNLLVSKLGGTIGKIITGIKVIKPDGKNISFKRSFFRHQIGYLVSGMVVGLGFFWIIKDKKRQAWHDQIADTFVIVKNPKGIIMAIASLIFLIAANTFLISKIFIESQNNRALYESVFQDIYMEINSTPTQEPTNVFDLQAVHLK